MTRRAIAMLCLMLLAAGCRQDMDDQPRVRGYDPWPSGLAGTGQPMPPEGTVPRDDADADARPRATMALLQHGAERFAIFCAPCHDRSGHGAGPIVRAGFPAPPSLHDRRIRALSADEIFNVATNGFGVMYGYRDRLSPHDRWAVVAYIRALQLAGRASAQPPADDAGGAR